MPILNNTAQAGEQLRQELAEFGDGTLSPGEYPVDYAELTRGLDAFVARKSGEVDRIVGEMVGIEYVN